MSPIFSGVASSFSILIRFVLRSPSTPSSALEARDEDEAASKARVKFDKRVLPTSLCLEKCTSSDKSASVADEVVVFPEGNSIPPVLGMPGANWRTQRSISGVEKCQNGFCFSSGSCEDKADDDDEDGAGAAKPALIPLVATAAVGAWADEVMGVVSGEEDRRVFWREAHGEGLATT